MSTDPPDGEVGDDGTARESTDDVVTRGIEALQAATADAIAAARAVLDVAEELVTDPRTAAAVSNLLGTMGRSRSRERRDDEDGEDGVQRIPVS
jgi:hypothetical protein